MRKRPPKPTIYWTLSSVLAANEMTAYALAKRLTGIVSPNTVYRAARVGAKAGAATGKTLGAFCKALNCQPGALLEYR